MEFRYLNQVQLLTSNAFKTNIIKFLFINCLLHCVKLTIQTEHHHYTTTIKGYVSCPSCNYHEQMKEENLESIKRHVLEKLGFKKPPTLSHIPNVPESILNGFYNKLNDSYYVSKDHYQYQQQKTTASTDYLSDQPFNEFRQYNFDVDELIDDDDEVSLTKTKKIYLFSKLYRTRHRDMLMFQLPQLTNLKVPEALLNIYIHGGEWLSAKNRTVNYENLSKKISIQIHQLIRRPSNATKSSSHRQYLQQFPFTEVSFKVDSIGGYVQLNITDLVTSSTKSQNPEQLIVFVKTLESWQQDLLVLSTENESQTPFVELTTIPMRSISRQRRALSLDCTVDRKETRCCRYKLEVDFRAFGWDWIIAPENYSAYFCAGECQIGYMTAFPHTHLLQMSSSARPCCSPRKMSPLSLLYFNDRQEIVHSVLPNMIVDKCSCS